MGSLLLLLSCVLFPASVLLQATTAQQEEPPELDYGDADMNRMFATTTTTAATVGSGGMESGSGDDAIACEVLTPITSETLVYCVAS